MSSESECNSMLSFEKSRFQYCKELFEREGERKEILEKKAQAILSLATLLMGAIFLKLDFLYSTRKLIAENHPPQTTVYLLYASLLCLSISLWLTLFSLMKAMRLQRYKGEHPENFISSIFAPDSAYVKNEETSFFSATAMSYAIALEQNRDVNNRKAEWVKYGWYSMIAVGVFLGIFLFLYVIISLI